MARTQQYGCTNCGKGVRRDLLLAKKVLFTEMGEGGRTQRARVVAWLCPECTANDPDWNRQKGFKPSFPEQMVQVAQDG